MSRKILVMMAIGFFAIPVILYFVIFGTALQQDENHIGILFALPKAGLTSQAIRVDDRTYLAKQKQPFFQEMEQQGYLFIDQLGAGLVFEKNGKRYFSYSRMYSRFFMLFSYPSAPLN